MSFDLKEFSKLNLKRCTSPEAFNHALDSWSAAEWTNAMAGEWGEALDAMIELLNAMNEGLKACNSAKKLLRHRDNVAGNIKSEDKDLEALRARARKEIADSMVYGDLAIQALGGDSSTEIREVFNAKSRQLGSDILVPEE